MNSYYVHRDMILKQHITSIMQLPTFLQGTLHSSTHTTLINKQNILPSFVAMSLCSGQKPVCTRAKKSIASFRLRKGQLLGCKVTLRRDILHNFLQTLITGVLPQVRDLAPLSITTTTYTENISGLVGLSFGIKSYIVFPQIEDFYDIFESCSGLTFTCLTSKGRHSNAAILLSGYGFPIFLSKKTL